MLAVLGFLGFRRK
ncbi:hypothetical protein K6U23_15205 [Vibrio fluvialis]|nr:hypothetical protein [Vibrio fluvialis]